MNKYFESFVQRNNLKEKGDDFVGQISGLIFTFNFKYFRTIHLIFKVDFYSDEETKLTIINEISNMKIKLLNIEDNGTGLMFGINDNISNKRLFARFDGILEKITNCLSKHVTSDPTICPACGKEITIPQILKYKGSFDTTICKDCYTRTIEECKELMESYNNHEFEIIRPIFGAILGAAIAAVIFIILYMLGYISAIVGLVAVYLGSKFYIKYNGKPDYKMAIIVSVVSFLVMCLTVISLYYFVANNSEYTTSINGVENFMNLLADPEAKSMFISDMLMTILFTFLGVVCSIPSVIRKNKITEKEILESNSN